MTGAELVKIVKKQGCFKVRQAGSHVRISCGEGKCVTTIPVHAGQDLGRGLLRAIERDLEPCLGKHWLRRR